MFGYTLALLTPIAVLATIENDCSCKISDEKAVCNSLNIPANETCEFERITQVQFLSASGDLDNNTMQYFPMVYNLQIFDSNITDFSIESDIITLKVNNSIFPKVTNDMLNRFSSLHCLMFRSNPGLRFDDDAFRNLTVYELTIVNQYLPRIGSRFFEGIKHLDFLKLINNGIRDIDENAFQGLDKLYRLTLDNNPIQSLHVNFSGLPSLRTLSLFGTDLKRIDLDVLSTAELLQTVGFPTSALMHMNATELHVKMPRVKEVVLLEYQPSLWPGVAPVLEEMKKMGIKVKNFTVSQLPYLGQYYPLPTC